MRRPADEVGHVHSGAGAGAEPAHGDVRGAGMVSSRRTMRPSARENAWPRYRRVSSKGRENLPGRSSPGCRVPGQVHDAVLR